MTFSNKLALNRWVLGQFGCEEFERLAKELRDDHLLGIESDGTHRFHSKLRVAVAERQRPNLPDDRLLEIDHGIVADTRRLNEARLRRGERPIKWRYFQWLALFFTEIYLDRFLRDPDHLREELNAEVVKLNDQHPAGDRLAPLDTAADAAAQLNQLSFWMATGSGKTLLMHAHLRQFQRLLAVHGRKGEINRTILLTPKEGLSRQHEAEFRASGIPAAIFEKDRDLLHRGQVAILEFSKLADQMKDKQVDVAAFESANLVFVDEGHRGASAGKEGSWMRRRAALTREGFSFEYSATFGQAVKGNADLTDGYARSTIIDYSYRWFHADGYGKDYRIFNLEGPTADEWQDRYLLAALLTFFRQQWLHRENRAQLVPYNLEHPLWVFVGGSVTTGTSTKDVSDVVRILTFLDRAVRDRERTTRSIGDLLERGLDNGDRANLFPDRFAGLGLPGETGAPPADVVFERILRHTFNAPGGGGLMLERLRNAPGEVALRVGENDPFGVVNVGDPGKLLKRCEAAKLTVRESEFAGSLFDAVNRPDSTVHVVIGARKFTEGWNSWRVSSMGLMNVGQSEGSQIIQMFGRGVRLKGRDMSLKRSFTRSPPPGDQSPDCLRTLETLQVFGVKASYMASFRDFLEAEGVSAERTTIHLPINRRPLPSAPPLKTIRLPKEVAGSEPHTAFLRLGPRFTLCRPHDLHPDLHRQLRRVELDCYPKVRTLKAGADTELPRISSRHEAFLTPCHVRLLDMDSLFTGLVRFKTERGWHSLTVSRTALESLLVDTDWYQLRIPKSAMRFDDWRKVAVWQEAAAALLKKYATHLFGLHRKAWENERLEYGPLDDDDPNLLVTGGSAESGYRVDIEPREKDLTGAIRALKAKMAEGRFEPVNTTSLQAVKIDEHLYWPLLWANPKAGVQVAPPALNEGEFRFVQHFRSFVKANQAALRHVNLHLIRNQSRGRGIGFFEAGNFHPDFILWAVEGRRQRIAFIDPKGLVHIGPGHDKVKLHETIKKTEKHLGDPAVQLDSFIVSVTPYVRLGDAWSGLSEAELEERHVLFQNDEGCYIGKIFDRMGIRTGH